MQLVVATVALLLVLTLSASPSLSLTIIPTLRLQLFNDSLCTVALPIALADNNQPVSATGLDNCAPAPSSLSQAGFSSYQAACGVSANNQSFAFVHLWSSSSANASSCPTTASLTTFITVGDSSLTHNASSCVGPVSVSTFANQSSFVSSFAAFAQFSCGSTSNAAHAAADYAAVPGIVLLLLLLSAAVHFS